MFFFGVLIFFYFFNFSLTLCPDGSEEYFQDKTHCLYFNSSKTYFIDAQEICMNLGGNLTSVHSMFDNMFLSQQALLKFTDSVESDFWFGANNLANPGVWSWMDGTPFDFIDWDMHQPTNVSGSGCGAVLMTHGKWIADDCYKQKPFVCIVNALLPATTPTTITSKPKSCPFSYTYYNETGFCYAVMRNETWPNAEKQCQFDGGHLASIHDITEDLFITDLAFSVDKVPHVWIGLFTEDNNAHYYWTDGTPFDYPNWSPGQPDTPGVENCGVIWGNGKFNNLECNYMTKYVCKILPL